MNDHPQPAVPHHLPIAEPPPVPAYTCHVLITPLENGRLSGQVVFWPEISAEAQSERDLLFKLIPAFKQELLLRLRQNESIPSPKLLRNLPPGHAQRLIPVHL